jgi:hypothetical protein
MMPLTTQLCWLFLLSVPVACVAWTVTHEELFREPRDFCERRSKESSSFLTRKLFYLLTCEYCFSHYVALGFLLLTHFHLLMNDWRGYLIAWLSLVWIANIYMSLYGLLRTDLKKEKTEVKKIEEELGS